VTGEAARLFVGLQLPEAVRLALGGIQPSPREGLRPVAMADMHITLHFIGFARIRPVTGALARVVAPGFRLVLTGPGMFRMKRGRRILWIGVEPDPALIALHRLVGDALESTGFVPETRRFSPHITLARLNPKSATESVDAFLEAALPPEASAFECREFSLFSSDTTEEGARYTVIQSWPLAPDG
jgi:2'-5' RNA ligase